VITITIDALPIAKQRPRFGRGKVYTPMKTKIWEKTVASIAKISMIGKDVFNGAVSVDILVQQHPTLSWPQWKYDAALSGYIAHTAKPDIDNVAKGILDAMNGIVYVDDSQIRRLSVNKQYGLCNLVKIEIEPLPQVPCNVKNIKEFERALTDLRT